LVTRVACLAALVVLGLSQAACGGGGGGDVTGGAGTTIGETETTTSRGGATGTARLSKSEYERRVSAIGNTLNKEVTASGAASATRVDPAQVDENAAALTRYANELAKLEPPEDIENAHDLLVQGSRAYARAMHAAAKAARAGRISTPDQLTTRLSRTPGLRMIEDATTALQGKGYAFGSSG
jgi:hypothetical protein